MYSLKIHFMFNSRGNKVFCYMLFYKSIQKTKIILIRSNIKYFCINVFLNSTLYYNKNELLQSFKGNTNDIMIKA